MKYIIAVLSTFILCIFAGYRISCRIVRTPGFRSAKKIITAAAVSIVLMAAICFAYLEIYYAADDNAADYLVSGNSVTVTALNSGFCFDGPGTEHAIIFFSGAKVEETAFAPLLFNIAKEGTDCFLLTLPFRMAVCKGNAPDEVLDSYRYDSWYMMGHSLGGIIAARYAANHPDVTDGVILLASYPDRELSERSRLLSIYGTNDGVLDQTAYEASKKYWPEDSCEVIIEGGNHAGFGDYGPQRGDKTALISSDEQQTQTVEAIKKYLVDY